MIRVRRNAFVLFSAGIASKAWCAAAAALHCTLGVPDIVERDGAESVAERGLVKTAHGFSRLTVVPTLRCAMLAVSWGERTGTFHGRNGG